MRTSTVVASLAAFGMLASTAYATLVRRVTVIYVVDASASISEDALERAHELVGRARARDDAHVGVVLFAADARVLPVPEDRDLPLPAFERVGAWSERTNAERALDVATELAGTQELARLVFVSDGVETEGSVRAAAMRARARGIAIHVVPPRGPSTDDTEIAAIDVPTDVRAGVPFPVDVRVASTSPSAVRIRLFHGASLNELDSVRRVATVGGQASVSFRAMARSPGPTRFRAQVETSARDRFHANDRRDRVVIVRGTHDRASSTVVRLDDERATVEVDVPRAMGARARATFRVSTAEGGSVAGIPSRETPLTWNDGRYVASFPLGDTRGAFVVHTTVIDANGSRTEGAAELSRGPSPEYGSTGPRLDLLREVAAMTGGSFGGPESAPFDRGDSWL